MTKDGSGIGSGTSVSHSRRDNEIGAAVQHLHRLHNCMAVGAGTQAHVAIAQLLIAGVKIDAMK